MEFRIADTFTDSLVRLTGDEQKAAKSTAFDLQIDPANPGMQLHRLDRAKDKNFLSVRVSRDLRLIVHRTAASLLLCYVGHHDAAYDWAERRKIERHPRTGAAQIVEIRETVREVAIPYYVQEAMPAAAAAPPPIEEPLPPLLGNVSEDDLLGYGVPPEWLDDARQATEDTLFALTDHLPAEAADALLELATGGTPTPPVHTPPDADEFAHPDAQRRFRLMTDMKELERALDYPWEKWAVFLHPAQRTIVERAFNGPARVAGSAGTGKTVVALHRAVHLARQEPAARVLLTTFSIVLARLLRNKLSQLAGNDPNLEKRITVRALDEVGLDVYESVFGKPQVASTAMIRPLLRTASADIEAHRFSDRFLVTEWADVVDAWQLETWEAYRDVARLGRKTRLAVKQREVLWSIFARVRTDLAERGLITVPGVFARAEELVAGGKARPYDFVVVDEAQDIGVPQLRLLAALGGEAGDRLFFAGDLGQRIFQTPYSWLALGVDVRGRSHTLRINYRNSHQIRRHADRLLPPAMADVDGNVEERKGTVSAFNGSLPEVQVEESADAECATIAAWLRARSADGVLPQEMAVLVRSVTELNRALAAVQAAGLNAVQLDGTSLGEAGSVAVTTMHEAKGQEFRAVSVAACDDEIIPLQSRIEAIVDEGDLEDVYNTERHLLYVACTRARDHLLVTGVAPASEFLDDFQVE